MQVAFISSAARRPGLSGSDYAVFNRGHAEIRLSRVSIFDRPVKRPTTEYLAEYYATVVRNADGSIDFDSYRKRAARFRGQQVRSGTVLGLACASILTLCCACAVIFAISAYVNSKPSVRGFNAAATSIQP